MPPAAPPLILYRDGGLWAEANRDRFEGLRVLQWRPPIVPVDPGVDRIDLLAGLPFEDASTPWIHAFHVLEHLDLHEARAFLVECRRVLRPGGRLRVSTPDFAGHLRLHLECLERMRRRPDDPQALTDVEYLRLLVLDQRVRRRSGGRMLDFLRTREVDRELATRALGLTGPFLLDLVRGRGASSASANDASGDASAVAARSARRTLPSRVIGAIRRRLPWPRSRPWWALDCRETRELEITNWDDVSLVRELNGAGFEQCVAMSDGESGIERWPDLDRCPRTGASLERSAIAEGVRP
ncbi:MAG: class I SAM-dependent methyltransferase [Planctomycetota bacterium]|jgi:SAM-dependent methyltransferase